MWASGYLYIIHRSVTTPLMYKVWNNLWDWSNIIFLIAIDIMPVFDISVIFLINWRLHTPTITSLDSKYCLCAQYFLFFLMNWILVIWQPSIHYKVLWSFLLPLIKNYQRNRKITKTYTISKRAQNIWSASESSNQNFKPTPTFKSTNWLYYQIRCESQQATFYRPRPLWIVGSLLCIGRNTEGMITRVRPKLRLPSVKFSASAET